MAITDEHFARVDALYPRAGGINLPASVILAWPAPNYINPETRGWTGPIILIVTFAATCVVFSARIWARTAVAKNFGLDDLLMSITMVPLIGLSIAVILANLVYGFQWHIWDQPPWTRITGRQIQMVIEILYTVSTSLIKISILCFYRRFTNEFISMGFLYWIRGTMLFVFSCCVTFTSVFIFTCTPVEGYWRFFDLGWRLTNELSCIEEGAGVVAGCFVSLLQDFFVCALPMTLVWNLQMPKRQKAALIGILALGLLTCVCGAMRTYYAIYAYYYTYDLTWYANLAWVWTGLEANLGVICASAPALRVFFRRYFNLPANIPERPDSRAQEEPQRRNQLGPYLSSLWSIGLSTTTATIDEHTTAVPLEHMEARIRTNTSTGDRDEVARQGSFASTRELTAPSSAASPNNNFITELDCRNVRETFTSDSIKSVKSETDSVDEEKGVRTCEGP